MPQPVAEADGLKRDRGPLAPRGGGNVQRDQGGFHVLLRGERGDQVEGLEHETHGGGPDPGHLGLAQLRQVTPVEVDDAA